MLQRGFFSIESVFLQQTNQFISAKSHTRT